MELKCAVSPFTSKVRKTIDKYYVLMNGNNGQGYCRVKSNAETQPWFGRWSLGSA